MTNLTSLAGRLSVLDLRSRLGKVRGHVGAVATAGSRSRPRSRRWNSAA